MPATVANAVQLEGARGSGWWLPSWASRRIAAGVTDRETPLALLVQQLPPSTQVVSAEQVHGAGIAIVEQAACEERVIAGCDALITSMAGVALLIRTADCLPMFFADPARGIIGLAHAGWRGLAQHLPARVVGAFRRAYQVPSEALEVAIGPAIRACCYEVGPEFESRFPGFVQSQEGRRRCDLIGAAVAQLRQAGVRASRIADVERCTACEPPQWFSLRREGPSTGRLTSLIALRP